MANTLFILNDPPYGTERSYNALRLAGALSKVEGERVRVFLIGEGAACAHGHQKVPQGHYNIEVMLKPALPTCLRQRTVARRSRNCCVDRLGLPRGSRERVGRHPGDGRRPRRSPRLSADHARTNHHTGRRRAREPGVAALVDNPRSRLTRDVCEPFSARRLSMEHAGHHLLCHRRRDRDAGRVP